MKKILFYLLSMALAGNMAFGAISGTATSSINLSVRTLPTVTVTNMSFGTYVLDSTASNPKPTDRSASITIAGGTAGKIVSISVPKALDLVKTGDNTKKVALTMSISGGSVSGGNNIATGTLSSSGGLTRTLTASMNAKPTVVGDYTGTATVTVAYN